MTPKWLRDEIVSGLQALFVLRLPNAPAAETAAVVGKIWIGAISSRSIAWDEQQDTRRVRRAFAELAATVERWPTPAAFLRAMPARSSQLKLTPPIDRRFSQKNREMLDALLMRLKKKSASAVRE